MNRHVVIGTAGHVDHGKTALVRRLTGVDTDRWEEEKRRGITIDLGFARLDLGGGLTASIVDVPGHEDFVRNMVAGATGVDVALLVIAADEGVMPQTTEHLAILTFLGVRSGVVAIAKTDLADAEWLELVRSDVRDRVGASDIRWEEPVPVSAVDGSGIDELLEALRRAARRAVERPADDLFRMPVDRVFSVAGAGTVVTGTTWSGSVGVGDEVQLLPGGTRARVRSVEVHAESRVRAEPGRRTALALPGVEKGTARRGAMVVGGDGWSETLVVDALVTLLPEAAQLGQRSRVRLHHGTAEVMARVTPAGGPIAPGSTGAARFRLEAPIVARWGDRAVLRSYSPVHTIGGIIVVDAAPPTRPRRPVELERRAALDAVERIGAFVDSAGPRGISVGSVQVRVGVHPRDARSVIEQAREAGSIVEIGSHLVAPRVVKSAVTTVREALRTHHARYPLEPGMSLELVRAAVGDPELADHAVAALGRGGVVVVQGGVARLAEHRPELSQAEDERAHAILTALAAAKAHGCSAAELSSAVRGEDTLRLTEFLVRQGKAIRVGRERYYDPDALVALRDTILDEVRTRGTATPSELRDRTGLSRKYLIPVLEWLDGTGHTVRHGDARRLGPAVR